ncbi:MAG: hypothetical protein ACYTHM_23215 [Planctomycetota bacterium]|jgi:hypothetical protein
MSHGKAAFSLILLFALPSCKGVPAGKALAKFMIRNPPVPSVVYMGGFHGGMHHGVGHGTRSPGYETRSYETEQFIPPPPDEKPIRMTIGEALEKTKAGMTEEEVIALFGERRVVFYDGEIWQYYIFPKTWDGDVWILTLYFEKGKVIDKKKGVAGYIPEEFRN